MDELKAMLKAVRDLQNSDSDTLVEAIDGLIETVIATGARLTYLNAWLESRGLPLDWAGPLDAWAWVVRGYAFDSALPWLPVQTGGIVGIVHEVYQPAGFAIRWDHATPEQRAEALRIEAERPHG